MQYYVYYDKKSFEIVDFFPNSMDIKLKNIIIGLWNQNIPRNILIVLSSGEQITAPKIKEKIGHSMSTLHENIEKLENVGLIKTEMIYKEKKQKIITPLVFFVTKNPAHKRRFKRFFQGLWVDSDNSKKIIEYLQKNSEKYYTAEEISLRTRIPVDDVELLLNNWDSPATKALSDFFKKPPFEKKVFYKSIR